MKPGQPSAAALEAAAEKLACDVRAIRAVATVEAGPLGAFLPDGLPVILFERHRFSKHTGGRFDGKRLPGAPAEWSLLSSPLWDRKAYGPTSAQHRKLAAAMELNRPAALMSCSWGLFQILGENFKACGYESVESFVTAMYRSVDDHLAAFVGFVKADPRLVQALRSMADDNQRAAACKTFARIYNGPQFAANGYDAKIRRAYEASGA